MASAAEVVGGMDPTIHFIVSRSRGGWAVNVDADRLSEHPTAEAARACAEMLARRAREAGQPAAVVDLSQPCEA